MGCRRADTGDLLDAARPYLRDDLEGEAVLSWAIHSWRGGRAA